MNVFEIILATMLFLQAPGRSIYSQVVVDQNSPPPCSDSYNLLCQPPKWNDYHKGYVVAESYEQGVERYATIAKQLEKAVYENKWDTPKDRLWKYVLTAVYHESGFRRDVHSGVGEASQGDCRWEGPPGKRTRVKGSCKSWCLGQILLGSQGRVMSLKADGTFTHEWYGKDLVGVDDERTYRCLYQVTKYMDRAARHCWRNMGNQNVGCVMGAYGGGLLNANDKRLIARYKTYNRMNGAPGGLTDEVKALLGIPVTPQVVAAGHVSSSVRAQQ